MTHPSLRLCALLLLLAPRAGAGAQGSAPASYGYAPPDTSAVTLSMDQAVSLSQQNNPSYLQTVAARSSSSAALRSAYGALMPRLSATLAGQYQQGGQQIFAGSALNVNSDVLQSSYTLGLTYNFSLASLFAPRQARASLAAAGADITSARETLRATVQQQYLSALESQDRARLQDTLVTNAQVQLDLATARAGVGSGTALDVQRAEVALGQQRVQQLQARNQAAIDILRLFQQIGTPAPSHVSLTTAVSSMTPIPPLDTLVAMAQYRNPAMVALRQRTQAASIGVSVAHSAYTPTLSVSTGIGGYTYQYRDPNFLVAQEQAAHAAQQQSCVQQQQIFGAVGLPGDPSQCAVFALTSAQAAAIRSQNSRFPFHFTSTPRSISLGLSLPLFDGFLREQRVQEAQVQWDNARLQERDRSLALTADVTAAYLTLQNARQTVALQTENAAKAHQELQFSQDQYTVGLATFVDLTTSRAAYAQAESDRIAAVYDYHKALAALESAVGRPLR